MLAEQTKPWGWFGLSKHNSKIRVHTEGVRRFFPTCNYKYSYIKGVHKVLKVNQHIGNICSMQDK